MGRGGWRRLGGAAGLAAAAWLVPSAAAAHVKWFEDAARYPTRFDLALSGRTAFLVVAAAAALVLLYGLQRLLGDPHWPDVGFLRRMAVGGPTLLAVQAAIGLVHAGVQPALLAPSLPLRPDALGVALGALQVLLVFSFITGLLDWLAALALLALGPVGFLLFRPMDVLDQLFWAGIAVVVLVVGRFAVEGGQARPWFQSRDPAWSARSVAALRVITGVALVAPALSEKVWNPELGAAFLAHHPGFNLARDLLGVGWFTDDRFVLAAGVAEGVIGVALASGLLTRVVILGMWLPFNMGVPFLPPQELLGHLPIFGIMYYLLVHSSGIAPGEPLDRLAPPGSPAAYR